jgi:hypothetical protein
MSTHNRVQEERYYNFCKSKSPPPRHSMARVYYVRTLSGRCGALSRSTSGQPNWRETDEKWEKKSRKKGADGGDPGTLLTCARNRRDRD